MTKPATKRKAPAKKVPSKTRSKPRATKKKTGIKCTPKQAEVIANRVEQKKQARAKQTAERQANPLEGEALAKARQNKEATGHKVGRPSVVTDELMTEICERIAAGESLNKMLKSDPSLPSRITIYKALNENPEFSSNYARACADRAEGQVDDIVELIPTINPSNAHAVRAQIDALKWVAGKMKPSKYSDKVIHAGHDGGPLTLNWAKPDTEADTVIDVTPNQPVNSISYDISAADK